MRHSLNQLADIIINNTEGGLKNRNGQAVTREQVKDEIILMRARLIFELWPKGMIERDALIQQTECLEFEQKDIADCPAAKGCRGEHVLHAKIPSLLMLPGFNPVEFVGSANQQVEFKAVFGNDYLYTPYLKYARKIPTAWFNEQSVWVFNEVKEIKLGKIRFVLEDPREISMFSCSAYDDDSPFPSPVFLNDMITGKLINDYHRFYSMKNPVIASKSPNHPNE